MLTWPELLSLSHTDCQSSGLLSDSESDQLSENVDNSNNNKAANIEHITDQFCTDLSGQTALYLVNYVLLAGAFSKVLGGEAVDRVNRDCGYYKRRLGWEMTVCWESEHSPA